VRAIVTVGERDVLYYDLRIRLVDAVVGRPRAGTGIGVQDPALAGAAQRHEPTAVQHDEVAGLRHAGGRGHDDRDWLRAAPEPDDPAFGDSPDYRRRRAARRRARADYMVRMTGIDRPPGRRDREVPVRVTEVRQAAPGRDRHGWQHLRLVCGSRRGSLRAGGLRAYQRAGAQDTRHQDAQTTYLSHGASC
jgi:hypothetical protein